MELNKYSGITQEKLTLNKAKVRR